MRDDILRIMYYKTFTNNGLKLYTHSKSFQKDNQLFISNFKREGRGVTLHLGYAVRRTVSEKNSYMVLFFYVVLEISAILITIV